MHRLVQINQFHFFLNISKIIIFKIDLQMSQWQEAEANPAEKFRTVAFTIPLNNNIGVKSTRAVESQVCCLAPIMEAIFVICKC